MVERLAQDARDRNSFPSRFDRVTSGEDRDVLEIASHPRVQLVGHPIAGDAEPDDSADAERKDWG